MSGISSSLTTASNALDVMEQAMSVIQNNVANATTPGYVTQTLTLNARAFDAADNLWGGVQAGAVQSSRNQFAEQNVWNQNTQLGSSKQQATSLSALQNIFGISGQDGIPSALSNLYSAFTAWSSTPTDANAQQQVLVAAQGVAQAFNRASNSAGQLRAQTDGQIQSTVSQINQLSSDIAAINGKIRSGAGNDAGLQSQLYNDLETLSGLANVQAHTETDGTVSVLMGGQVPLVLGTTQQALQVSSVAAASATNPGGTPNAAITAGNGQDVTADVTGGQLGGLLQFRNSTLPSVVGSDSQKGSLNQLAQSIADRVNGLLTSGQKPDGTPGIGLFTYGTPAAANLQVASGLTGSDLAPVTPGTPPLANGVASQLAGISSSGDAALGGQTYTDFYGAIASSIGSQQSAASNDQKTQTDLLTQAQNLRAQTSGVSLNEQAANLLQFQQAYEASAKMINVINSTMQYLLQMVG